MDYDVLREELPKLEAWVSLLPEDGVPLDVDRGLAVALLDAGRRLDHLNDEFNSYPTLDKMRGVGFLLHKRQTLDRRTRLGVKKVVEEVVNELREMEEAGFRGQDRAALTEERQVVLVTRDCLK